MQKAQGLNARRGEAVDCPLYSHGQKVKSRDGIPRPGRRAPHPSRAADARTSDLPLFNPCRLVVCWHGPFLSCETRQRARKPRSHRGASCSSDATRRLLQRGPDSSRRGGTRVGRSPDSATRRTVDARDRKPMLPGGKQSRPAPRHHRGRRVGPIRHVEQPNQGPAATAKKDVAVIR